MSPSPVPITISHHKKENSLNLNLNLGSSLNNVNNNNNNNNLNAIVSPTYSNLNLGFTGPISPPIISASATADWNKPLTPGFGFGSSPSNSNSTVNSKVGGPEAQGSTSSTSPTLSTIAIPSSSGPKSNVGMKGMSGVSAAFSSTSTSTSISTSSGTGQAENPSSNSIGNATTNSTSSSGPGSGIGLVDGKVERGQGVLRRLSLGGSVRPVIRRSPPAQESADPFDRGMPSVPAPGTSASALGGTGTLNTTAATPEIRINNDRPPSSSSVSASLSPLPDPGTTDIPVQVFGSFSDLSRSLPTPTTANAGTRAVSVSRYNNPFSGFSMDDHDHDHEHDDGEHAYERAFGRVGGSFLGRTKSVGSASASGGGADSVGGGGGVFGWRGRGTSLGDGELGRRRSIQEGPASSPTTNSDNSVNVDSSGVVGSGMRPRRVSFGWTGFGGGVSQPTSTPGPGSGSSSGSGSGPGSGGVPTAPKGDVRPDGLPGTGSGGLKVGRGRSGSGSAGMGGGKKRSVSPMGEHLLRGSGHF